MLRLSLSLDIMDTAIDIQSLYTNMHRDVHVSMLICKLLEVELLC